MKVWVLIGLVLLAGCVSKADCVCEAQRDCESEYSQFKIEYEKCIQIGEECLEQKSINELLAQPTQYECAELYGRNCLSDEYDSGYHDGYIKALREFEKCREWCALKVLKDKYEEVPTSASKGKNE